MICKNAHFKNMTYLTLLHKLQKLHDLISQPWQGFRHFVIDHTSRLAGVAIKLSLCESEIYGLPKPAVPA